MPVTLTPVVKVGGTELSTDAQNSLIEVGIDRELQLPARVTFRFTDAGYTLSQAGTFSLGTELTVVDPSGSPTLITAEVTSITVDQRAGEPPELVIVGHDRSHRLGRSTTVKAFVSMSYSDVVAKLAQDCGLEVDTDSTGQVVDYLMQCDSDLGLLTELARRVGFDWWVDDRTLRFKKPASTATVSLALGEQLQSFSVRASGHHPDSVEVIGWDRTQQQVVSNTATDPSPGVKASSDLASKVANPGSAFGQGTVVTAGLNAQNPGEATQLSQALLDRGAAAATSAKGLAVGDGAITLGSSVQVTGAGPLNGTYPVTGVHHMYRARTGYVTRFTAGDRWPTSLVDTLGSGRTSPTAAHLHPGLAVGQVTNINDPDQSGKVKVRFPGLSTEYESGWARIVGVGGGAKRGSVFIPEVDDEVLVAFESGDPRQPVVIGGLYGAKSTIPSPQVQNGSVQTRSITSRLGHVVTFQDGDSPGQQGILLQLAGGNTAIRLGQDKLDMTVPEGTPVNITAGNSSIKFGQDGSITIAAPSVSIQAEQQLKLSGLTIEASAETQLSLEGQATAALKGAQVQMQAEGPATISGEPVMIN